MNTFLNRINNSFLYNVYIITSIVPSERIKRIRLNGIDTL